ncbi:hypothetical protein GCM10009119_24700 [Algoriphagus jejuensis]|uniref:Uncharacterized protein n=1 Tax=Algoriphagus jejuensis TaxID=419934 RepID=A0ABN1N132_9BACT
MNGDVLQGEFEKNKKAEESGFFFHFRWRFWGKARYRNRGKIKLRFGNIGWMREKLRVNGMNQPWSVPTDHGVEISYAISFAE